jgi:hypothetical protein
MTEQTKKLTNIDLGALKRYCNDIYSMDPLVLDYRCKTDIVKGVYRAIERKDAKSVDELRLWIDNLCED